MNHFFCRVNEPGHTTDVILKLVKDELRDRTSESSVIAVDQTSHAAYITNAPIHYTAAVDLGKVPPRAIVPVRMNR